MRLHHPLGPLSPFSSESYIQIKVVLCNKKEKWQKRSKGVLCSETACEKCRGKIRTWGFFSFLFCYWLQ